MNNSDVQSALTTEKLLLRTYGVSLPPRQYSQCSVDHVSLSILNEYHPVMAQSHIPMHTSGNGNCLYRSVSLGLYDTPEHFLQLHLMTAMEMLEHRIYYDRDSTTCTKQLLLDVFPTVYPEKYDILVQADMLTNGEDSWGHFHCMLLVTISSCDN